MHVKFNGQEFAGAPGTFLQIERTWLNSTQVAISIGLNPRLVEDTTNYPGRMGLAVGPQVLAMDLTLNPEAQSEADVEIDRNALAGFRRAGDSLPTGWIGRQSYSVPGYIKGKPTQVVLVPYSDAGQTGGEVYVWIRRH